MPRTHIVLDGRFIAVALCVLLLQAAARDTPGTTEQEISGDLDLSEDDEWARLTRGLDALWSGSPAEKRAITDEADTIFEPLDYLDEDDAEGLRVVALLREFIRVEDDDWITSRLLQRLAEFDPDLLRPLFRTALKSRSINVQRRALQWFAEDDDPEALPLLEEAWGREMPAWIRADLVTALANHGAQGHFEDFLALVGSRQTEIAAAAITALREIGDPRALPTLVEAARRGGPGARLKALEALDVWHGSAEALEVLLGSAASGEARIQLAALTSLRRFSSEMATRGLLALARAGATPGVRRAAVGALGGRRQPEVVPGLVEVLYEEPSEESRDLRGDIIVLLHNLDDPAALPGLYGLNPLLGAEPPHTVADLVAYLSRDRSTAQGTWAWRAEERSPGDPPPEPGDPDVLHVMPPAGSLSVRCFEAPAVPGDPAIYERLAAGAPVRIADHFEREDDTWVEIEHDGPPTCWVPRRQLEAGAGGPIRSGGGAAILIRIEFDLHVAALDSDTAHVLMEAGLIETFDPEGDVIGAAVVLAPNDRRGLSLIARSFHSADAHLRARLEEALVRGGGL